MPAWVSIVNSLGFPAFVALVLLYRVYDMHAENIKAIAQLTQAVELLRVCITKTHFVPRGNAPCQSSQQ